MLVKKCRECGKVKNSTQFYSYKKTKDGLSCYCKKCSRLKCREWYKENKTSRVEYLKKWNKDNKKLKSQLYKQWYKSHRKEKRLYECEYRKRRKKNDPIFTLHLRMGCLMLKHLKGEGLKKGGK